MTASQTLPDSERVADWPRITATLRADGTGSLTVNGTERPCTAANADELRTGMIAHVALIAARLRRPVRLVVTEDADTWALAVRPEGIVQLVDAAGMIPPADGLSVHQGPCRACRHVQPVTATSCSQCGIERPHSVEAGPRETYQRRRHTTPTEHVSLPPRPRPAAEVAPPLPPLPPRRRCPAAAVTAHDDLQRRGPPAQWFVGKASDHGVTWSPFAAAAPAPLVGLDHLAGQYGTIRLESLPGDNEAEFVEAAEGSQVGAGERISAPTDGSVVHVEVFRAECVGALILGRPRPLSGHRRAGPPRDVRYTLIWEEPVFRDRCNFESRSIYAVLVALDGMLSSSRMEHGWLSQTIEPILAGNRLLADGLTSPRKHGSVDLHLSGTNDIP